MLTIKLPKSADGRVSTEIADRIQNAIREGKVRPGEKLPSERDMAKQLEVSRVSVREAYRSLAELGLLVVKRGAEGGAFITDLDHQPVTRSLSLMLRLGRTSLQELTEARVLLEPMIARVAAQRADPASIERLDDLVRKQAAAIQGEGDIRRYDLQFHRLVAACTQNMPLIIVMNALADLALEAISQMDIGRDVNEHVINFHGRIADAIRRGEGEAAHTIMLGHIQDVQLRLGKALERQITRPEKKTRRASVTSS
jgi:GntR family transcriptional regulator, transcriptional repressor for pyruvate dehydrogenase complex